MSSHPLNPSPADASTTTHAADAGSDSCFVSVYYGYVCGSNYKSFETAVLRADPATVDRDIALANRLQRDHEGFFAHLVGLPETFPWVLGDGGYDEQYDHCFHQLNEITKLTDVSPAVRPTIRQSLGDVVHWWERSMGLAPVFDASTNDRWREDLRDVLDFGDLDAIRDRLNGLRDCGDHGLFLGVLFSLPLRAAGAVRRSDLESLVNSRDPRVRALAIELVGGLVEVTQDEATQKSPSLHARNSRRQR